MSKEMAQSITLSPRVLVTTCQDDAFYDLEHLLDIEDSRVRPPSSPWCAGRNQRVVQDFHGGLPMYFVAASGPADLHPALSLGKASNDVKCPRTTAYQA